MTTYLFELYFKMDGALDYCHIRGCNYTQVRGKFLSENPKAVIISCSRIGN